MKKILFVISITILLIACDSNDSPAIENKRIKTITINQNYIDSLFYKNEKLTVIKTYSVGRLFHTNNYDYNTAGLLSKITYTEPIGQLGTIDYNYNLDGSLKSRKVEQIGFGGTKEIFTYNYTYAVDKITITDDRHGANKQIIMLDAKNRVQFIEKQNEALNGFYIRCEYVYDNKGNIITMKTKSTELAAINVINFDFDNKTNPFPCLDFDLPNGLSLKKLEAISDNTLFAFNEISNGSYSDFLNLQNLNNITKIKWSDTSSNYSYSYNDSDYASQIGYNYLLHDYLIKFTYE